MKISLVIWAFILGETQNVARSTNHIAENQKFPYVYKKQTNKQKTALTPP